MGRLSPLLTSKKTLDITYQNPQETLLGTPETLPTTEPDNPQASYTILAGYLPTLSVKPFSVKYIGYLIGAGKFVTAGTLSWRMTKNGSSVNSGTLAVAANTYYTVCAFFYDVAVDDVLGLKFWSNQTDSNYDYKALYMYITRLNPFAKLDLLTPFNMPSYYDQTLLTLGNPSPVNETNIATFIHDDAFTWATTNTFNRKYLGIGSTYKAFQAYRGDRNLSNNVSTYTDVTYRPKYVRCRLPAQFVYRGVILG